VTGPTPSGRSSSRTTGATPRTLDSSITSSAVASSATDPRRRSTGTGLSARATWAVVPGRVPVSSAGGLTSTPSRTQATVEVGASSTSPSVLVQMASCAPAASAARTLAMLTAYDVLFTPPSSQGACWRRPAGRPSDSVTALIPCSRACTVAAGIGPASAKPTGWPPGGPLLQVSRSDAGGALRTPT
jgi:hypothetical protein